MPARGTTVPLGLPAEQRERFEDRVQFCVFENGRSDFIYVGVRYGLWSGGEFDLQIDGATAFTGKIEHLLTGGVLLDMGDVVQEQPSNASLRITRITGTWK